jgi:hypothetical protein
VLLRDTNTGVETIYSKAAEDFHTFCTLLDKPPAKHMLEWHRHLITGESNKYLLDIAGPNLDILAPRGPLAAKTSVATPEGWKPLEEIQVGDFVYGDDGEPTEVLEVLEYDKVDVFKVLFSDGTSLICDDSHRFDVRRMGTDPKNVYRKTTLQEIRTFVTTGVKGNWRTGVSRTVRLAEPDEKPWLDTRGHSRYQVPVTNPVNYPHLELPIKSTCLNMFTAWIIGRHTTAKLPLQIIYVSYNIATAIPKSRIIRQIIDSPEFRKVFPRVQLKSGMQSDIGWSIDFDYAGIPRVGDEEFTLRAAGLRGSITSKRAHLVIVDDPIKSSADIKNPAIREEMNNNWSSVIAPIVFEGGRSICLGTRFHPLDIHKTMFVPDKGWKQVTQEAITYGNTGEPVSYWPEQWSAEYLLGQKELDPVAFAFQYQQQPVMTSDLVVSP